MQSVLKQAYPAMQMDRICRVCRGKPQKVTNTYRCKTCQQCDKDYEPLRREVEEFDYLYTTWQKVRRYWQLSTGIQQLDNVITLVFGPPHNRDWRNYTKVENLRQTTVLRLARV